MLLLVFSQITPAPGIIFIKNRTLTLHAVIAEFKCIKDCLLASEVMSLMQLKQTQDCFIYIVCIYIKHTYIVCIYMKHTLLNSL